MFPSGTGPNLPDVNFKFILNKIKILKGLKEEFKVPPFKDVNYTDIGSSALPKNY